MKPILLIDSSFLCYRAMFTTDFLSYKMESTGVVFGFLRQLLKLHEKFKTNQMVFLWDSKSRRRENFYPQYKATRKKKTEEEKDQLRIAYQQFASIKNEILPGIGFQNHYSQTGLEADDLFAVIAQNYREFKDRFVIISSDNDLWQLLHMVKGQYDPGKDKFYTEKDFEKQWDIKPWEWAEVKTLSGCSSDNVKGIKGMMSGKFHDNEKAIALMKDPERYQQALEEHAEKIEMNRRLVTLPYPRTRPIDLKLDDKLDYRAFVHMCNRYSFDSIMKSDSMLKKWKEFLR